MARRRAAQVTPEGIPDFMLSAPQRDIGAQPGDPHQQDIFCNERKKRR
jgi:hypothetical protein